MSERDDRVDPTLPAPGTPITSEPLPPGATRTGASGLLPAAAKPEADLPELPTVAPSTYAFGAEVARGGMGRISVARDRRLHRPVAIKEVLDPSPELAARFEREARITARLQHPAIVNVYEAGRWPTGEPFFAMKMVRGRSLKEVVGGTRSLAERIALLPKVIQISEALAYAHAERVVHRDLKPSNVLVGDYGETVVIDWGLAKDLRDETAEKIADAPPVGPDLTVLGAVMGTPGYMAPEQVDGVVVDERADVFALGAILYFVLTGRAPFHGSTSTEILTATRLMGHTPIATEVPGVPRDLATIVEKAMARDPAARYPTARELAEELTAFQTGQLVKAHQYSRAELVRRWIRRHRGELFVAGLAIVLGGLALGEAFRRILNERDRSAAASQAATRRADELTLAQARQALDTNPRQVFELLSNLSLESPGWSAARLFADEARRRGLPEVFEGHTRLITSATWNPKSRRLATGDLDGHIRVWQLDGTSREIGRIEGTVVWMSLAPDGDKLVVGWRAPDGFRAWGAAWWNLADVDAKPTIVGEQKVWFGFPRFRGPDKIRIATPEGLAEITLSTGERRLLFEGVPIKIPDRSADGRWLAVATLNEQVEILDETTGERRKLDVQSAQDVTWSPTADWLAISQKDGPVELWSRQTGTSRRLELPKGRVTLLCWLDAKRMATISEDQEVRLWSTDTAEPQILRGHTGTVSAIDCAKDGSALVTASEDGTVRIWDAAGKNVRLLAGFVGEPGRPKFLHDSPLLGSDDELPDLVVTGSDEHLRLYHLRDEASRPLPGPTAMTAVFSPDGRALVASHADGTLRVHPTGPGPSRTFAEETGPLISLAALPDGRVVSVSGFDEIKLWDPQTGQAKVLRGIAVGPVRVAPDGRRLAALSARTSDVFVWDAVTAEARALVGHTSWVNDVAWIGSDRLATTGEDGTVRLWDLAGTRTWSIATKGPGNHIRLSADGEWIFAAGVDWIRAFHLPTARVVDLGPLRGRVTTIEVARQGLTLAAGFESGGALVWSEPGAEPKLLYARAVPTSALAFDATGRTLAIAAVDGWLAQWDLGTGEHRDLRKASPDELGHQFRTVLVGWSPDGELFFTGGSNDPTVLWSDELPREPAALREWLGGLRGR